MKKDYKYLRYIAYVIEILVFYIVQRVPNLDWYIARSKPVIIIPIAFAVAVFEGEKAGAIFGLFAGVLLDLGLSGGMGLYSVTMCAGGYLVGHVSRELIGSLFLRFILIVSLALIFVFFTDFLFLYVLKGFGEIQYALRYRYLPRCIYTMVLVPFVYFFNKSIFVRINQNKFKIVR